MIEAIFSKEEKQEDKALYSLRPELLSDFVGQVSLKKNIHVYITAAQKRKEALDHTLLSGPPGLGKTTLSLIIAKEMKANVRITSAPTIERTGDMAALLSSLRPKEILFIDEIHRLKPIVEEVLYSAMEDFKLDLNLGGKGSSRAVRINIAPFTLIGATTKPGSMTQPLISRFGIIGRFNFYHHKDLESIARRNAAKLKMNMNATSISEISKRSRGTPRILNRLLRRVRDFADVQDVSLINSDLVSYALGQMQIDEYGLDDMDRRLLQVIIEHFKGGPVGIETLSTSLSEDSTSLEEVYEPYLIQLGFLKRTRQGRMATPLSYKYLKIENPKPSDDDSSSLNLF